MPLADDLPDLLRRLDARADALGERSRRLSRVRLGLVLAGAAAAAVVGNAAGRGAGWLTALAALGAFLAVARVHDRVEAGRTTLRLWRTLRARDLARLGRAWDDVGPPPTPAPPGHPYARDLDVAGPRSLLHLLDTTGTQAGHRRLRALLLGDDADGRATRQRRARALVPRRRFRQRLEWLGRQAAGGVNRRWGDAPVRAWLAAEPDPTLARWAVGLGAVAAATVALLALSLAGGPSLWPYTFGAYVLLYLWKYQSVGGIMERAYDLERALGEVAVLLRFAEADGAGRDPALAPLWAAFRGDRAPSRRLDRLHRIVTAAGLTRNTLARIGLNALLPYDLLLTLALDRLRADLAGLFGPWVEAVAEIEALAALAAYADREPGAVVFPMLDADGPLVEAEDLRHPLLAEAVGNPARLERGGVLLMTGSNMSGKSTYLRAVGLASVLANAGGPVPARSASVAPLRPVTSMRIGDVLQEGLSTFYAEVRRLRALLDVVEADGPPALVVIDEMLRGTNNRERLAGAQGVVRALVGARATSMVATHDLALADLADDHPELRNAHFRETTDGDRLAFDYRLRPGPCPTTNALVIMHRAGLPVALPDAAAPGADPPRLGAEAGAAGG